MRLLCFLAVICFVTLASPHASCDEYNDFLVQKDADITVNAGGYFRILTELNELPAGKRGRVVLKLTNTTKEDLFLGRTYSGCSCASLVLSDDKVRAGGGVEAVLSLTTPANAREANQAFSFTIGAGDRQSGASAIIRYRLAGLASFREASMAIECRTVEKRFTFRLPLVMSNQEDISKIRVSGLGSFSSAEVKLLLDEGQAFAECTVDATKISELGMAGEFELMSPHSEKPQTLYCTILRPANVQVAPVICRLKWNADDKEFTGSSIVKIDSAFMEKLVSGRDKRLVDGVVNVSLVFPDAKVVARKKELSKGVYRVEIALRPEAGLEDFLKKSASEKLNWVVSILGTDVPLKSVVSFVVP